jgi:hypothetical protein
VSEIHGIARQVVKASKWPETQPGEYRYSTEPMGVTGPLIARIKNKTATIATAMYPGVGRELEYMRYAANHAPALAEQVLADAVTIEGLRETVAHPPDTEALIERLTTRIVELERLLWPDGRPRVTP